MENSVSAPVDQKPQSGIIYRMKDIVYIEDCSTLPFKIGQISNFKTGPNGAVFVKIRVYERRRGLEPSSLKKLQTIEEKTIYLPDYFYRSFKNSTDKDEMKRINHQFRLRSLIPHKPAPPEGEDGYISAAFIRGKCQIFKFVDVENAEDYIDKDDVFYYVSCYEDQKKKISCEGESPVVQRKEREERCADIQSYYPPRPDEKREYEKLERDIVIWDGRISNISEEDFQLFSTMVRSVGLFGRALDQSRRVNDSSIQSNLSYSFRDSTKYLVYSLLHKANYNWKDAIRELFINDSPIICTDQLELWSEEDIIYFYEEIKKYKRFSDIPKSLKNTTWKSAKEMVEFYYMHKVTELYLSHKKERITKKASSITQIFIPTSNIPLNSSQIVPKNEVPPSVTCEGCKETTSSHWYNWSGQVGKNAIICSNCWVYWKKYGGLYYPHPDDGIKVIENPYICNICSIPFSIKKRYHKHNSIHFSFSCDQKGCVRKFLTEDRLKLHKTNIHNNYHQIPVCSNNQSKLFLYISRKDWMEVRKELASYAVSIKMLSRRINQTFERNILISEDRMVKRSTPKSQKKIGDISLSLRKRSSKECDTINQDEPPAKIPLTV